MVTDTSLNSNCIQEVPANWQIKPIESLCQRITSGGTPSRKNPSFYRNGNIRWIKTKELKDWYINDSEEKITIEALNNSSAKLFPVNTILMAMYGDGITITSLGILQKESATNQACCALITNPEICDYLYLFYSLKHHRNDFIHLASGGAQRNLNSQTIKNFNIRVPPIFTQQKIVNILSAYDRLIKNNTKRIKILEEMAQTLYREWFVNFRFPGCEQVKMVDSELGLIPEGWEFKSLRDICERVDYGYTAKANFKQVGLKFLRITDIVPYLINWNSVPYCEISSKDIHKFLLKEGDIVIARTGATAGYAKRLNKRHPDSIFASYLVRIRVNQQYANSYYIGLIVESDRYKEFIKANISGAAQPQANARVLTSLSVLVPPNKIQDNFKNLVSAFFDEREILQQKNVNLCKTRDLLLPKLISGEIDVENLDIESETTAA